ncbi:3-oxo-5alpha-steroid 4-dehydrogenase [Pseudonocardia eucalypti]|uniref:FAD-dependent oxidoreductase n=1 Tax=Pseudonocardia eucalypti TaxID=648755 RepID=UPI00161F2336|nr:3-oxo-5alpha-steroid 4-dehydrogenase [Pseudonocardia eucalypti]
MEELVADVVVVGFGAAGACAAIEAARGGASVVVLDRFSGGGATALSGGVVYAGGGTSVQRAAGVSDTPEDMYRYLREEVGDGVREETLRRFCEGSVEMIDWLASLGVPFRPDLCPYKTSYPSDRHFLYYSGSEAAGGFRDVATPAPRGHRAVGRGISGAALFGALAGAARRAGAQVLTSTKVVALEVESGPHTRSGAGPRAIADGPAPNGVCEPEGEVAGESGTRERVAGVTAVRVTGWAGCVHRVVSRFAAKPGLYYPPLRRVLHAGAEWVERRYGRPVRVLARRGVVLSSGGFIANRELVREHAPAHRGGLALGTPGDDGTGLRLGQSVGGATAELGSISVWRFITPPSAFLGAVLVDAAGRRVCDESRYGAALGHALVTEHGGRGWLVVDAALVREARRQLGEQTVWFQRLQAEYLLRSRASSGATLAEAAAAAGVDPEGVSATVKAHNEAAGAGQPDPAGKPAEFVHPLVEPPFALLDISIAPSAFYPCPMMTLGGLVVDEETGAVLSEGGPIPGLYAAGRTAVGICTRSYVSGLSLADCVFSGRRAGRAALSLDTNENVF